MAELLVARVLADYAGEVVIVDRDRVPEQPEFRAGSRMRDTRTHCCCAATRSESL